MRQRGRPTGRASSSSSSSSRLISTPCSARTVRTCSSASSSRPCSSASASSSAPRCVRAPPRRRSARRAQQSHVSFPAVSPWGVGGSVRRNVDAASGKRETRARTPQARSRRSNVQTEMIGVYSRLNRLILGERNDFLTCCSGADPRSPPSRRPGGWTCWITTEPSPTAEATRFTEPRTDVADREDAGQAGLERERRSTVPVRQVGPVSTKPC